MWDYAEIQWVQCLISLYWNLMGSGSFRGLHSMQPSLTLTHPDDQAGSPRNSNENTLNDTEHYHDPNVSIIITPPIAFIPEISVDLYAGELSDHEPQIDSDVEIVFQDGDGNLNREIPEDVEESIILVTTEMLGDD